MPKRPHPHAPHSRDLDARVTHFVSPVTRMLLASEGLTTPLLQAASDGPLRARVWSLREVAAGLLDPGARERLRLSGQERCLVRRTRLVLACGTTVSDNVVVARMGVDPRVDEVAGDPGQPLGFGLADAGVVLRRRVHWVGRRRWFGGGPCVCKAYTLDAVDGPLVHVEELFSPQVVPADVRVTHSPQGQST
ncbi:hypothetical protein [Streptomyces hainanensis]|uniref:hypothetical protein n=1 Tax=Streptomyces hainanensis TaxID=402648 RepID=UPI0014050B08|nr:hypothetical protein [Streptomyces hainanensis]